MIKYLWVLVSLTPVGSIASISSVMAAIKIWYEGDYVGGGGRGALSLIISNR